MDNVQEWCKALSAMKSAESISTSQLKEYKKRKLICEALVNLDTSIVSRACHIKLLRGRDVACVVACNVKLLRGRDVACDVKLLRGRVVSCHVKLLRGRVVSWHVKFSDVVIVLVLYFILYYLVPYQLFMIFTKNVYNNL